MEYKPFETGIEVLGGAVYAVIAGFSFMSHVATNVLREERIGERDAEGKWTVVTDKWYSQEAWLRAFGRLARENDTRDRILYNIGCKIPENAVFPPWVVDVRSAVRSIDIAYHMNHRKNGQVMYDAENDSMLEGIGHYGYEWIPEASKVVSVCRNPYPCAFDRGIIHGICYQQNRAVRVVHVDSLPCRNRGDDSCTYEVLGVNES